MLIPTFRVQRFAKGHPLYSDSVITNNDPKRGAVGTFKAVFGQFVTAGGEFIHYTMERADTLIKEGSYTYGFYDSPANKCKVILLMEDPDGNNISARKLEHHIANYPFELKGCTAHGMAIDVKKPMIASSGIAFHDLMKLATGPGVITYETLK